VRLLGEEARLLNAGARGIVAEGILDHLGRFKSFTTQQCWWKQGGAGQLWQTSSYDRVIRYNDSFENSNYCGSPVTSLEEGEAPLSPEVESAP